MKLLVTGGAGFIGNALILKLREEGHSVVCVDSMSEYYDVSLKVARLNRLDEEVEVYKVDFTDKEALSSVFKKHTFDVVCHLGAQPGVRYSITHPDVYVKTNVNGTFNILECMRENNVKRMVFASTSSVYGNNTSVPFVESAPADRPVSIYAATKRSAELLSASYFSIHGIESTCLRFFTVYGPYSRPDMAPMLFTERVLKGEAIDVFNNGDMRRDFTYIDDIVSGFVKAVEKPLGYEVINLGNGSPIALMEFIEKLEEVLGVKAKKNMLPMQAGDVKETFADINKARKLLGYEPATDFSDGLAHFVKWYREYYGV